MNYKLTPTDYRDCWLILTPEEIEEEFGEYSHTSRHIRGFYKKFGLSKLKRSKQEFLERIEIGEEHSKKELFADELLHQKERVKRKIWNKIREYQKEWDYT